jgi:two-component system response regulator HydG
MSTDSRGRPRLLVIDDDPGVARLVERFAADQGFEMHFRPGGAEGLAALEELSPDVALVDLQMPGLSGLDVLNAIRDTDPDCHTILMTGDPTVDTAIAAIKAGARDYLAKPFDRDRLTSLLTEIRRGVEARERLLEVEAGVARDTEFHGMVGRSPVSQQLFENIRRFAPHVRTVLITGETGTGKELAAKAFHAVGPRHARRFVTVNCSAVVETLFESELFGHVRGAFTGATENKVGVFEHANHGTLFLDEVGELPLSLQAKLLRAVEQGEIQRVGSLEIRRVDVLIIAATNRDLRVESAAGRFRSDLYYRLGIIEIDLPPLRARREDIPYLAATFIRECAARLKRRFSISGISAGAEQLLLEAPWPGNIRQLRNVIERACIMSGGGILTESDLSAALATSRAPAARLEAAVHSVSVHDPGLLATAEREHIRRVLSEAHGNKAAAAKTLGVSRRSLYRWIERLHVPS